MNLLRSKKEYYPVYWVDNFLTNDEIEKIKTYAKTLTLQDAKVGGQEENEKKEFTLDYHIKDPNIGVVPRKRITDIKWFTLNENTNWLFKKIIDEIIDVNGKNFDLQLKFVEDLQFSEYTEEKRGFYTKHRDCGSKKSLDNYVDIRKLSFTIQLTDENEYEGGELIFYIDEKEKKAPKSKGTIVFFESDILHEVTSVTKGVRHSLVSWVQGPNLR
jgi:PKHD-type hydroxylase|tara:strand:- start:556 stop:1200 length:645 start_codon:yes stop_codon:yes gene_type:complete